MMKKLLLCVALIATTMSYGQTHTASLSSTASTKLVLGRDGKFYDEIGVGNYATAQVTITTVEDTEGNTIFYKNDVSTCYFVFKRANNNNVFSLNGNLTHANATSTAVDGNVTTRTWVLQGVDLQLTQADADAESSLTVRTTGSVLVEDDEDTAFSPSRNSHVTTTIDLVDAATEVTEFDFETEGDLEGFTTNENGATASSSDGTLVITTSATAKSGVTTNGPKYIDASTYKYAHVFYRNKSTNTQFAISIGTNVLNKVTGLTTGMADEDEFVQTAGFDLSTDPAWTGNISTFTLQPRINNNTTAAGDFIVDKLVFTTGGVLGVDDAIEISNVTVYPNPTTGIVNISDIEGMNTITVSNVLGQVVKTFTASNRIDISSLKAGMYVLQGDNGLQVKVIKN